MSGEGGRPPAGETSLMFGEDRLSTSLVYDRSGLFSILGIQSDRSFLSISIGFLGDFLLLLFESLYSAASTVCMYRAASLSALTPNFTPTQADFYPYTVGHVF